MRGTSNVAVTASCWIRSGMHTGRVRLKQIDTHRKDLGQQSISYWGVVVNSLVLLCDQCWWIFSLLQGESGQSSPTDGVRWNRHVRPFHLTVCLKISQHSTLWRHHHYIMPLPEKTVVLWRTASSGSEETRSGRCSLPFLAALNNYRSLLNGVFLERYKTVYITPLIKISGLDSSDVRSYRPISNYQWYQRYLSGSLHGRSSAKSSKKKTFYRTSGLHTGNIFWLKLLNSDFWRNSPSS